MIISGHYFTANFLKVFLHTKIFPRVRVLMVCPLGWAYFATINRGSHALLYTFRNIWETLIHALFMLYSPIIVFGGSRRTNGTENITSFAYVRGKDRYQFLQVSKQ